MTGQIRICKQKRINTKKPTRCKPTERESGETRQIDRNRQRARTKTANRSTSTLAICGLVESLATLQHRWSKSANRTRQWAAHGSKGEGEHARKANSRLILIACSFDFQWVFLLLLLFHRSHPIRRRPFHLSALHATIRCAHSFSEMHLRQWFWRGWYWCRASPPFLCSANGWLVTMFVEFDHFPTWVSQFVFLWRFHVSDLPPLVRWERILWLVWL